LTRVVLKNVSVDFPVHGVKRNRARPGKKSVGGNIERAKNRLLGAQYVRALRNVSLELNAGDRVGILGHNGAGKSTIMKVIAGVYLPSRGSVDVEGRCAAIFRSALGMELNESGYENIFLTGLLHGFRRSQIQEKLDEIVEFAELGEFLHLPVRTYSAGMRTRLTFAVATTIRPQILILDEGIGAGDEAFAAKARKRMQDLVDSVEILLVASHSRSLLRRFCDKGLLMKAGEVAAFGDFDSVEEQYIGQIEQATGTRAERTRRRSEEDEDDEE
jgi:ABC-2 type transport system ATP-binding protein